MGCNNILFGLCTDFNAQGCIFLEFQPSLNKYQDIKQCEDDCCTHQKDNLTREGSWEIRIYARYALYTIFDKSTGAVHGMIVGQARYSLCCLNLERSMEYHQGVEGFHFNARSPGLPHADPAKKPLVKSLPTLALTTI